MTAGVNINISKIVCRRLLQVLEYVCCEGFDGLHLRKGIPIRQYAFGVVVIWHA